MTDSLPPLLSGAVRGELTDSLRAEILLSRAETENLNGRSYTAESMAAAVEAAQQDIALGRVFGFIEHPEPLFTADGQAAGFDERGHEPAFRFTKLWMDGLDLLAEIELLPTSEGESLRQRILAGEQIRFSLRALGSCAPGESGAECEIHRIEGGDAVTLPALPEARLLSVVADTAIPQSRDCDCVSALDDLPPTGDTIMDLPQLIAEIQAATDPAVKADLIAKLVELLGGSTSEAASETEASTESQAVEDALAKILSPADRQLIAELRAERIAARQQAAVADALKQIEQAGQWEGRSFANYPESVIQQAFAIARQKPTPCDAKRAISDALDLADALTAQQTAASVQRTGAVRGATVQVVRDHGDSVWIEPLNKIEQVIADSDRRRFGREAVARRQQYARANQEFAGQVFDAYKQKSAKYLAEWGKRAIADAANPITAADLRNQEGVVAGLILRQVFQRLTALQFVAPFGPAQSTMLGKQFKIPVTSFTSPSSQRRFSRIKSGDQIPEAESAIRYVNFFTKLRAVAYRVEQELADQIQNGVLQLDAVAMLISDISEFLARETDSMILFEMQSGADRYNAAQVTSEAVAAAEWAWSASGSVSINAGGSIGTVTYGSNVYGAAKLLTGNTSGYTSHPRPIVAGVDTLSVADDNTETESVSYATTVATLGGITQVEGYLDSNSNIASFPGTTATFAVDHENGIVVFRDTATSGAAAATRPTISYWYCRNYNEFNLTPSSGVAPENHYSGLLRLIRQMAAVMGSSPIFRQPDLCLFPTTIGLGAYAVADLFEQQRLPVDTILEAGYAQADILGELSGIIVAHTNGQMFAGSRRAILTQRNATMYGVGRPLTVVGPLASTYSDGSAGRTTLLAEELYYARILDVAGTPLMVNGSGSIINPPSKTIRFVGNLTPTVS